MPPDYKTSLSSKGGGVKLIFPARSRPGNTSAQDAASGRAGCASGNKHLIHATITLEDRTHEAAIFPRSFITLRCAIGLAAHGVELGAGVTTMVLLNRASSATLAELIIDSAFNDAITRSLRCMRGSTGPCPVSTS